MGSILSPRAPWFLRVVTYLIMFISLTSFPFLTFSLLPHLGVSSSSNYAYVLVSYSVSGGTLTKKQPFLITSVHLGVKNEFFWDLTFCFPVLSVQSSLTFAQWAPPCFGILVLHFFHMSGLQQDSNQHFSLQLLYFSYILINHCQTSFATHQLVTWSKQFRNPQGFLHSLL